MRIVVLLSGEAAGNVRSRAGVEATEASGAAILQTISGFGYRLQAMHPGARDPELSRYFYVETPDQETADAVALALRPLPGVEGAYVKPAEELP